MTKKNSAIKSEFLSGVKMFFAVQAVFMLGGLLVERMLGVLINGIPSAIGLLVVLFAGIRYQKSGRFWAFIGSYAFAFLVPLILYCLVFFSPQLVQMPLAHYVARCVALLVGAVYLYIVILLLRKAR